MDTKKEVKHFIMFICDCVENSYKKKGHDGFNYRFHNDKIAYLIADKGIEPRIRKELMKRLKIKSKVEYTLNPSIYKYPDGMLYIKLYPFQRYYEQFNWRNK